MVRIGVGGTSGAIGSNPLLQGAQTPDFYSPGPRRVLLYFSFLRAISTEATLKYNRHSPDFWGSPSG